jgi:sulfhydrogenase subunit gamma (sulfur reductase)
VFNSKLYVPRTAIAENVKDLTYDTKLYRLRFKYKCKCDCSGESDYRPGQFVQVSVLGAGEVPISICSSPAEKGYFELCIRNTGLVTGALAKLAEGDELGIRGPYGNFFPMEEIRGQGVVFIGGGIGLAPLRSAIRYVMDNREEYGEVKVLYGARTREDIVFASDLDGWSRQKGIEVYTTIDRAQEGWTGHVGVVTTLLDKIKQAFEYKAFVCGPPIMIHFTIKGLLDAGWAEEDIITTLERHMKCGVGKCGHCYIGGRYVCTDGPVFTYAQIKELAVGV